MKSFDVADSVDRLTAAGVRAGTSVPAGSVLFVVRGMSLANEFRVGVAFRDLTFNQDLRALVPHEEIDGRYLARFLQASSSRILTLVDEASHGTKRLTSDRFEEVEVPVPSLDEQRRIATILDKADALRAQRRAALAQIDTLVQAIFLDMFGDPATNPKGWRVRTVGEVLESATYGTSEKAGAIGELPVLRMNNITRSGEMDFTELKYMDLDENHRERYTTRAGDVLFNRTNSPDLVGKTAILRTETPMAYAGYLIRLRVNRDNDPEYLAAFLNTDYSKRVLRGMCKSIIGMANINATELRSIKIPAPELLVQREFARCVAAAERLKANHRTSRRALDTLFASLQSRAFQGEL